VVVDADGETKRTRPLAGVNGEVCKKKKKAVERKQKRLDTASIVRDGRFRRLSGVEVTMPVPFLRLALESV
jgi:hypothetical protein